MSPTVRKKKDNPTQSSLVVAELILKTVSPLTHKSDSTLTCFS